MAVSIPPINPAEDASKADQEAWEKFAADNKGMWRIGAVECTEFAKICSNEGITTFPTYKVIAEMPIPPITYIEPEGGVVQTKAIKKIANSFIGDRTIEISSHNYQTFKEDNPGKPKLVLFTNKAESPPVVYRALSTYFDVSLLF